MKTFLSIFGTAFFLLLAGCATPDQSASASQSSAAAGSSDPMEARAAAGRALLDRYANAVVKIELVATIRISMNGRSMPPREEKIEVNGTVISSAGLTVASLSAIDPGVMFEEMRSSLRGAAAQMELGETEYKEVKLSLSDGTEVPARVVLKDADLDLAFIAPETGNLPANREFACVKLDDAAKPEILGAYYDVSRASKQLQRVPLVHFSTVSGIVQKPRQLFIASGESVGCPVFDARGAVLGICLRHLTGGTSNLASFVILPSVDVADEARQAAAAAAKPDKAADAGASADTEKTDTPADPKAP